jgi:hypothetical protein
VTAPKRIQRKRTRGWRMPENAVYVGRGSKWGNPFRVGDAQLRYPREDGTPAWEYEGRLHKPNGRVPFVHGDGVHADRVTWHDVRHATREECVTLFRDYATGERTLVDWSPPGLVAEIRAELAGKDLACWCPLVDADGNRVPCHADVLLEIANGADQ